MIQTSANKPIRRSTDMNLDVEKADNTKLLMPGPIENLGAGRRRFSGIFKKLENFELISSSSDDDLLKYNKNYFIHEYSSDSEGGSFKSCVSRICLYSDEEYSELDYNLINKNMSDTDIKYYEVDEEGIIEMQRSLIAEYYAENPQLKDVRAASSVIDGDILLQIFPKSKDQKPGYDLYNYGVVFQCLIVFYVLFFYSQISGDKEELSETLQFKRFRTEMIIIMFAMIMLILLDRFFYISNTFDHIKDGESDDESVEDTEESEDWIGSHNRYNIIKLAIYVFMVILIHAMCIWYFPITGNYKINEQIYCDSNGPCNDLQENKFLWGFYLLNICYLFATGLQFRYGLPEIRKGHFMYENFGFFSKWAFNTFFWLPFLFEVKTFIDWTFTKTSLFIWDWFTFETIYSEFYEAKVGVEENSDHKMGEQRSWIEKILFGLSYLLLCLGLILAPLIIFSSLNPISEMNLVKGAGIELNIELEEGKSLYNIFSTTVANEIRNITEDEFSLLNFRRYKELRVSDHSLYQRIEMLPYSDKIWSLSPPAIRKMKDHFEQAMKTNFSDAAISLEYSFNRQYPPGSNVLQRFIKMKFMDINNYPEIFRSFYEALNSTECKPVFIKLERFYPSVIHLTSDIRPEIINIKYKTINLKLFCTADPLISSNIVKYWTMYIEDDFSAPLNDNRFFEEDENDQISISIRPRNTKSGENRSSSENSFENESSLEESRKNRKIIEDKFKNRDSIPVIIHKRQSSSGEISKCSNNTNNPSEPIQTIQNTTKINIFSEKLTDSKNINLNKTISLIKSEDEGYGSYFSSLLYQDSADQEQEEPSLETELKEAELGLKIPEVPSYSPELLARLDDEKHLGRESNQQMGELTGSIDDIQKDEEESSEQMGLVLYTFSDKVTPGLINYSVITFYVSIVFVAGKLIRSYLWGDTPRISIKEVPYPDELLIICEGVVISRMRKDIYREEELYMLLIDLIRSPEILKEITHPLFKTKKE